MRFGYLSSGLFGLLMAGTPCMAQDISSWEDLLGLDPGALTSDTDSGAWSYDTGDGLWAVDPGALDARTRQAIADLVSAGEESRVELSDSQLSVLEKAYASVQSTAGQGEEDCPRPVGGIPTGPGVTGGTWSQADLGLLLKKQMENDEDDCSGGGQSGYPIPWDLFATDDSGVQGKAEGTTYDWMIEDLKPQ